MPPKRKAVSEELIQSEPTGAAAKKLKKVSAVTIEHCKSWYASLMLSMHFYPDYYWCTHHLLPD
jgi:hypothetical protein